MLKNVGLCVCIISYNFSSTSAASIRSFRASSTSHAASLTKSASLTTTSCHHHCSTRLHHHILTATAHMWLTVFQLWQVFPFLHYCDLSAHQQSFIFAFGADCSLHRSKLHIRIPQRFTCGPCSNGGPGDLAAVFKVFFDHLGSDLVINIFY